MKIVAYLIKLMLFLMVFALALALGSQLLLQILAGDPSQPIVNMVVDNLIYVILLVIVLGLGGLALRFIARCNINLSFLERSK